MAFISPPPKIPFFLRIGLWVTRKITRKELLPARLLAWYPKFAVSSAVLEGLIAHGDGELGERILKMVRMTVSFTARCPFCMDMNSSDWEKLITLDELAALQGRKPVQEVLSLSYREQIVIQYARLISLTPLSFPQDFITELKANFTEREIVVLAATAAQVNYWARLIQALGCPPAGFSKPDLYLELPVTRSKAK